MLHGASTSGLLASCLAALALAGTVGCHTPSPPPQWASGGAALVLPADARWIFDDETVELRADGKVVVNGRLVLVVDRVGRVVNDEYEPLALLMPDGTVVGTDSHDLGHIGRTNGAPPGSETAWFSIQDDGRVIFFDREGDRREAGRWSGCTGPSMRACALVSHVFFVRARYGPRRWGYGPGFGPGLGIGFGYATWR
jgi:hypothetical protein